jgi:transcriptional regulator with XRE-family HTH domain
MSNSLGERIRQLRQHYHLGVKEFASMCSLSHVAVFQMENGRTAKPHKSSMHRIARVFGTSVDWLLFGKNEMLPNGTRDIYSSETDSQWKEEAYLEIKNRNVYLEREVERLWQIIGHFTVGNKPELKKILDAG